MSLMPHLKTVFGSEELLFVGMPDFTKNEESSLAILGGSELS